MMRMLLPVADETSCLNGPNAALPLDDCSVDQVNWISVHATPAVRARPSPALTCAGSRLPATTPNGESDDPVPRPAICRRVAACRDASERAVVSNNATVRIALSLTVAATGIREVRHATTRARRR